MSSGGGSFSLLGEEIERKTVGSEIKTAYRNPVLLPSKRPHLNKMVSKISHFQPKQRTLTSTDNFNF